MQTVFGLLSPSVGLLELIGARLSAGLVLAESTARMMQVSRAIEAIRPPYGGRPRRVEGR